MVAFGSALNPPTHPPPPLREQPFGGPKIPPATLRERAQNFKTRKRLFRAAKPPISYHEVFWAPQGRPLEDPTQIPPALRRRPLAPGTFFGPPKAGRLRIPQKSPPALRRRPLAPARRPKLTKSSSAEFIDGFVLRKSYRKSMLACGCARHSPRPP